MKKDDVKTHDTEAANADCTARHVAEFEMPQTIDQVRSDGKARPQVKFDDTTGVTELPTYIHVRR